MAAQAYDYLAEWFEFLNDDCDYPAWSQYFIAKLEQLQAGKRGLELGCGSGAFCRALTRAGYSMSGADLSIPMLTKAEQLSREEGLNISYFQADASRLNTPQRYDFILSPNDCFNYLPQSRIPGAFRSVFGRLQPGGIFLFDISSEYKLRRKVADTVSADDREEVTYLSFNREIDNAIEMNVTLFVKQPDGAFLRFDERHVQYIHSEAFLREKLQAAGFRVLAVEGHLGEEKEGSDRLNFICKR